MRAYFCDRCGQAYPFRNVTIIHAYRADGKIRRLGGDPRERIELCPNCILKLDNWINSNGKGDREGNENVKENS